MGDTLRILRPDDLLVLEVELVGLAVAGTASGPIVEAVPGAEERLLVFRVPPQHIAEEAYFDASPDGCGKPEEFPGPEGSDVPDEPGFTSSRLATASRVVFSVPGELLPLPLSLDALLAWQRFEPVVPPACRAGTQDTPPITEPGPTETALELPWRLWLAPEQGSAWQTTDSATLRAGRSELWRAVLGRKEGDDFHPAGQTSTVPIRAVWSPDWRPPNEGWLKDLKRDIPFRSSLRPGHRHQLVVLTSGFVGYEKSGLDAVTGTPGTIDVAGPLRTVLGDRIADHRRAPYRPEPAEASRLWVSALGASLRCAGTWESVEPAPPDRLDRARAVLEEAIVKLGAEGARLVARELAVDDQPQRDRLLAEVLEIHGKRVLADLALQPDVGLARPHFETRGEPTELSHWSHDAVFGRDQKVVVVEEGALFPLGHRAAQVTVTERRIERTTTSGGGPVAALYQYTYVVVRQRVRTLPLTVPQSRAFPFGDRLEILTTVTPHLSKPVDIVTSSPGAFWIMVQSGSTSVRLPFSCAAIDADGARFTFTTPLVFVGLGLWTDTKAATDIAAGYTNAKPKPGASVGKQRVALAAPKSPGSTETTVAVDVLTLKADARAGGPDAWVPAMAAATVEVPDIARIAGSENAARTIAFDGDYVTNGPVGLGVWANIVPGSGGLAGLGLTAGGSGGIALPEFSPSALSRELGPTVGSAVGGAFDPEGFFPDAATLFGVIKLKDLVVDGGDATTQAPKLTSRFEPSGAAVPTAVVTDLDWSPSIADKKTISIPMVEVDRSKATLALSATVRRSLDGGPGSTVVKGVVRDLTITIAGAVAVEVAEFRFGSADGSAATADVQLGSVGFAGPLEFLTDVQEQLQKFSGLLGGPVGPKISVEAASIKVDESIALPPFTLAVFALHDVRLTTGVTLPLLDGRPSLRFVVAERHHPFTLTISLLGGGGYLELEIDTEGIKALDAAIEFGGEFQLDIGVASGGVRIMAGFFFTYDRVKESAVLGGFVEASGFVSVLGIVTVSVVFRLELGYDLIRDKIHGSAEVIVSVSIFGLSKSVSLKVERSFGADGGDPDFAMLVAADDWDEYAEAFA